MRYRVLLTALFCMLLVQALRAQSGAGDSTRRIVAVRTADGSVSLDGKLDDAAWRTAIFVSDFGQKDPVEGATPSQKTEIAFLYDEDALYVGARMYHTDLANLSSIITRRDRSGASERVIVSLDTYRDRRTAYSFSVTAAGVRTDYYHSVDEELDRDFSFDPVWQARSSINDSGWIAEMRIPFSQLRFNDRSVQEWGININRYIPLLNEDIYYVVIPRNVVGWSSRFAVLTGITDVKPSARVEVLPYVAAGAELTGRPDTNDPYDDGLNLSPRAGVDLKVGLGPNLTLDATINPDFGQVEADPAEVNLSQFESFFSERRPFFVEGSELLAAEDHTYFYSRRVGAPPHGWAEGDYVDMPRSTTILGAAKVTGRLASGLSLGALAAVTGKEHASARFIGSDEEKSIEVEPATGYGVLRLQQEFGESGSTAGMTATGLYRDLSPGDPLSSILPRRAFSGGGGMRLLFNEAEYEMRANVGMSYIEGDSNAIASVQRNSAHYFQRPDAGHVELDPARTSLAGYTAYFLFAKNAGEHWLWNMSGTVETPGFDLNDAGILSTADEIDVDGMLTYRETTPGDLFRSYSITLQPDLGWNFDGVQTYFDVSLNSEVTWTNFWNSHLGLGVQTPTLKDRLTRGGPLMRQARIFDIWGGWDNGYGSHTRVYNNYSGGIDEFDGWYFNVSGGLAMNVGDRWEFSIDPYFSRSLGTRQYVSAEPGGGESTFGRRFIFSHIDRTTISLQLRVNFVVTPDLSLELYGEPFAASGHYHDFGELAAAGSGDLSYYGDRLTRDDEGNYVVEGPEPMTIPNPDFYVRSFRSNTVLRWEWLPGSTLYLVWQMNRGGFYPRDEAVGLRDLADAVTEQGPDYLALKVSYWLPVQ